MLAVVVRWWDNTAKILNLNSGVVQLTVNTSIEVSGLGVIGIIAVAIGDWKASLGTYL